MSTLLHDVADELLAVLGGIDGLRATPDGQASVDPPYVVLGPPLLAFEAYNYPAPSTATFVLYAITAADDRMLENLWEIVPQIVQAVEESSVDAAVSTAHPGVYPAGGQDLPCYQITVEVSLQ